MLGSSSAGMSHYGSRTGHNWETWRVKFMADSFRTERSARTGASNPRTWLNYGQLPPTLSPLPQPIPQLPRATLSSSNKSMPLDEMELRAAATTTGWSYKGYDNTALDVAANDVSSHSKPSNFTRRNRNPSEIRDPGIFEREFQGGSAFKTGRTSATAG